MYDFLVYQTRDVMTSDPTTLGPDGTLAEAEAIFEQHDWNGLPITDEDGALVGFLTKLDLLRAFEFDDEHVFPPYHEIMQTPVGRLMQREIHTVNPRTPLTRVLSRLLRTGFKSLPVLDADDRLVGIVAREDVMRALRRAVSGEKAPADDGAT
jgi:CBS domain-containing protein